MTLEEIKAELIAEQDDCDTVDSWGLGKYVGIQLALNMLDQLKQWHPFPEEKPTENGYYQVTFDDSTVDLARWKDGSWTFNPKIIAWAELPKPYKKEANNDH